MDIPNGLSTITVAGMGETRGEKDSYIAAVSIDNYVCPFMVENVSTMLASLWRHSNTEGGGEGGVGRSRFFFWSAARGRACSCGARATPLLFPFNYRPAASILRVLPFYIRDIKRSLPGVIDLLITFPVALHPGGRVDGIAEQTVSGHLETHHASHAWSCKQTRRQHYANRLCPMRVARRSNAVSSQRTRFSPSLLPLHFSLSCVFHKSP